MYQPVLETLGSLDHLCLKTRTPIKHIILKIHITANLDCSCKHGFSTHNRLTDLETKLLKIRHISGPELFLSWPAKLCFQIRHIEHV